MLTIQHLMMLWSAGFILYGDDVIHCLHKGQTAANASKFSLKSQHLCECHLIVVKELNAVRFYTDSSSDQSCM